jgi:hypothetical protein
MQKSNTLGYVEKRNKVVYANGKSERARERERDRTHAIFAVATVRIPISLVHDTQLRDYNRQPLA